MVIPSAAKTSQIARKRSERTLFTPSSGSRLQFDADFRKLHHPRCWGGITLDSGMDFRHFLHQGHGPTWVVLITDSHRKLQTDAAVTVAPVDDFRSDQVFIGNKRVHAIT